MPPFIDLKGVAFRDGTTDGEAEVEARKGTALKVDGSGKLHNAQAAWKNTVFSAQGHTDLPMKALFLILSL